MRTTLWGYHKKETDACIRRLQDTIDSLRAENTSLRGRLDKAALRIEDLQTLLDIDRQIAQMAREHREGA